MLNLELQINRATQYTCSFVRKRLFLDTKKGPTDTGVGWYYYYNNSAEKIQKGGVIYKKKPSWPYLFSFRSTKAFKIFFLRALSGEKIKVHYALYLRVSVASRYKSGAKLGISWEILIEMISGKDIALFNEEVGK